MEDMTGPLEFTSHNRCVHATAYLYHSQHILIGAYRVNVPCTYGHGACMHRIWNMLELYLTYKDPACGHTY